MDSDNNEDVDGEKDDNDSNNNREAGVGMYICKLGNSYKRIVSPLIGLMALSV